jgi:hypothetical protein
LNVFLRSIQEVPHAAVLSALANLINCTVKLCPHDTALDEPEGFMDSLEEALVAMPALPLRPVQVRAMPLYDYAGTCLLAGAHKTCKCLM